MTASTLTYTPVKISATALHHYAGLNWCRKSSRSRGTQGSNGRRPGLDNDSRALNRVRTAPDTGGYVPGELTRAAGTTSTGNGLRRRATSSPPACTAVAYLPSTRSRACGSGRQSTGAKNTSSPAGHALASSRWSLATTRWCNSAGCRRHEEHPVEQLVLQAVVGQVDEVIDRPFPVRARQHRHAAHGPPSSRDCHGRSSRLTGVAAVTALLG